MGIRNVKNRATRLFPVFVLIVQQICQQVLRLWTVIKEQQIYTLSSRQIVILKKSAGDYLIWTFFLKTLFMKVILKMKISFITKNLNFVIGTTTNFVFMTLIMMGFVLI